ncbi:MAG: ComF family protein [Muribaculaceae bacterium]|nr:ComF family protein [Muribaculaceae bacterium]
MKPATVSRLHTLSLRLGRMLRRASHTIWPVQCALCDNALQKHEDVLCLKCLMKLPVIHNDTMLTYIGTPGSSIRVRSWFVYSHDDPSHRLIHHIKYNDRKKLARKLGREFTDYKHPEELGIDVILPIPLHWSKYVARGYNQSHEIALGIADMTGIKIGHNLYAKKSHSTQTSKNRDERADNVRDIFSVRHPEQLDGKNIALLDDVITTGATMFSALKTILAACTPASVTFLSLARTNRL